MPKICKRHILQFKFHELFWGNCNIIRFCIICVSIDFSHELLTIFKHLLKLTLERREKLQITILSMLYGRVCRLFFTSIHNASKMLWGFHSIWNTAKRREKNLDHCFSTFSKTEENRLRIKIALWQPGYELINHSEEFKYTIFTALELKQNNFFYI